MEATKTLLTAEDLLRLPDSGRWYELVKGELVEMTPVGLEHGDLAALVLSRLRYYVEAHQLGLAAMEVGFFIERAPDTVRAPDVCFISAARLPSGRREGYFEGAPDLAVEVISPGDVAVEVEAKVQDYLSHGTRLVWVVHPRTRTVTTYHPDGSARVLRAGDMLEGEDVVPGFQLALSELFA
jgi:Uma2 family endonuclease